MMLSALSLSMMQLMVKLSAQSVGTFEQVFCRNLFSMAIAAVLLRKERLAFRVSSCRGPLFLRSLFGFLGILLLFLATARANQADVSAIFGAGGQFGLTYAYQKAPASEASIYNYISIPFSAILGIIFLQEHYTVSSLVGSLLIIGGGALSYLSHKKGTEKQPHC